MYHCTLSFYIFVLRIKHLFFCERATHNRLAPPVSKNSVLFPSNQQITFLNLIKAGALLSYTSKSDLL